MIKHKKIFFAVAIILSFVFAVGKTQASLVDNVVGWLWGGGAEPDGVLPGDGTNTNFGWVSMNSVNCDANGDGQSDGTPLDCPPIGTVMANYGVNIPLADGPLTGSVGGHPYVWSENVGWIDFAPGGDFVAYPGCGFPKAPCVPAQRSGNNLQGWARITKIADAYAAGNSGDWQGWIRMSSDASDPIQYGVSLSVATLPATLLGSGWSDELGWIDFSGASVAKLPKLIVCESTVFLSTDIANPMHTGHLKAWYWIDPLATSDCDHLAGATEVTVDPATNWLSDKPLIVSVDSSSDKGKITGEANGFAEISVKYNSIIATATASVNAGTLCIYNICDSSTSFTCQPKNGLEPNCAGQDNPICTASQTTCFPHDLNWREVPTN